MQTITKFCTFNKCKVSSSALYDNPWYYFAYSWRCSCLRTILMNLSSHCSMSYADLLEKFDIKPIKPKFIVVHVPKLVN